MIASMGGAQGLYLFVFLRNLIQNVFSIPKITLGEPQGSATDCRLEMQLIAF
jgi:hypothetical protein